MVLLAVEVDGEVMVVVVVVVVAVWVSNTSSGAAWRRSTEGLAGIAVVVRESWVSIRPPDFLLMSPAYVADTADSVEESAGPEVLGSLRMMMELR